MVRATKAKQPAGLVFVNIGHPDETKTSEFREKVARTAMINRPREAAPATTTKAPSKPTKAAASKAGAASSSSSATKATTSSRPIPPPRHASSTPSITSLGGHQNSLTSPDEVVATTAASPQYGFAYQQASPPALEYAIASPESADLSPPSLFQYNSHDSNNNFASNPQHADNSYFRNYDLANTNANGSATQYAMNGYTSPPIVTSPPSDDSNSYSATHKSTSIDSSTSSRSIAKIRKEKRSESNSTNNNTQGLQVARKKAFKQKHNPSVTGMISGIPDFVVRDWNNDTNPTRSVGAILDPFDALPVKANAHTQELLYQYVNAYLMSPQLGERGSPIHTRLTLSRQKLWWPMVMRSKAALCALIAYIETTPDLPIKATSPDYLSKHQSAAIRAIHDSLTQAKNEMTDDEICFAIVLLMIAAQRQNDKQATATHAQGLKTILARRAVMFDKSRKLEDATAEKGTRFPAADNGGDPAARCLYCRGNIEKESSSRESSPELPEVPTTLPADDLGKGFFELIEVGMLSYEMKPFIETSLKWNEIAQQARRDRLSAACGASHAWTDGNIKDEARTPFDMAVMFTVRITLYLSAWLDWNHSCQAVKKMVGAVNESLKAVQDMDSLMQTCPDIVLWSTLLTGPYTEDEKNRELMLKLAGRAAESLAARTGFLTFDDILTHISNRYLWTSTMTPAARTFFFEGLEAWQPNHGAANSTAIQHYLDQLDAMKSQQNNRNCMAGPSMMSAMQGDGSNINSMNHDNFAEVYHQQGMADLQAINNMNNMNGFNAMHDMDANHIQNTNAYLNDVMLLPQVEGLSLQDQFLDMYSDYAADGDYVILDHNGVQIPNPATAMYEQGFVMDPAHYDPNALDMNADLGAEWMMGEQAMNGMNGGVNGVNGVNGNHGVNGWHWT